MKEIKYIIFKDQIKCIYAIYFEFCYI